MRMDGARGHTTSISPTWLGKILAESLALFQERHRPGAHVELAQLPGQTRTAPDTTLPLSPGGTCGERDQVAGRKGQASWGL